MNCSSLVTKLKSEKWMIQAGAYNSLADNLNLKMADTTLKLSPVKAQFTVGDNNSYDPEKGAAMGVIYVTGILVKGCSDEEASELGLCNIDSISEALDEAANDSSIASVCLWFNSPGGETTGLEELARKIASFPKPVYGWTETKSASAAYWLMSQCQYLGMTPSAEVGSVGVYLTIEDYTEALKQAGITKEAIYSGKFKLLGANFRSLTDEERKILQADVNSQHDKFKQAILAKRQIEQSYFEGLTYEGKDALQANLVDVVVDDFATYLTTMTDKVIKINTPQAKAEATTVPIQNLNGETVAVVTLASAEPDKDKEPEKKEADVVPGVPEDKQEPEKAQHYDGGYASCPSCKHTWKLEAKHIKKMQEAEEGSEPAKDEPEKKAEAPEQPKEDDKEKKMTTPIVAKKADLPSLQEWQAAFNIPQPTEHDFIKACRSVFNK